MKKKLPIFILAGCLLSHSMTVQATSDNQVITSEETNTITVCPVEIEYTKEVYIYDGLLPTDDVTEIQLNLSTQVESPSSLDSLLEGQNDDVISIIDAADISDTITEGFSINAHIDIDGNVTIKELKNLECKEISVEVKVIEEDSNEDYEDVEEILQESEDDIEEIEEIIQESENDIQEIEEISSDESSEEEEIDEDISEENIE